MDQSIAMKEEEEKGSSTSHPHREVLLTPEVRFIDELIEVIQETGAPSLRDSVARAVEGVPYSEQQKAMQQEMSRYWEEVEIPAARVLAQRKISRPSAMKKVPVPLGAAAAADEAVKLQSEGLNGIELDLGGLAKPPKPSTLALRVSWPPDSSFRRNPKGALIASAHRSMLALYVGRVFPGNERRGFYLVYDARANSVSAVPPVPLGSGSGAFVNTYSHAAIGTRAAILCTAPFPDDSAFILADLFLHRQKKSARRLFAATFLTWRSSAGGWTREEVALPRHAEPEAAYNDFHADLVFAAGDRCLCWVDLLQGILMCDDMLAADHKFRFVPLPAGTAIKPSIGDRGMPQEHRSMCCACYGENWLVKFLVLDGFQGEDYSRATITTWTLELSDLIGCDKPRWALDKIVFYGALQDNLADGRPLVPSFPFFSVVHDHVIFITVSLEINRLLDECILDVDDSSSREYPKGTERYVLCVDMTHRKVLGTFKLPPGSGMVPPTIFASSFSDHILKRIHDDEETKKRRETCDASTLPAPLASRRGRGGVAGLALLLDDLDFTEGGRESSP